MTERDPNILYSSLSRCLASALRGDLSGGLLNELKRIRAELLSTEFKGYVGAVDAVLAA